MNNMIPRLPIEALEARVDDFCADQSIFLSGYSRLVEQLMQEYPNMSYNAGKKSFDLRLILTSASDQFDKSLYVDAFDTSFTYGFGLIAYGYLYYNQNLPNDFSDNNIHDQTELDTLEELWAARRVTQHEYPELLIAVGGVCSRRIPFYDRSANRQYLAQLGASCAYSLVQRCTQG